MRFNLFEWIAEASIADWDRISNRTFKILLFSYKIGKTPTQKIYINMPNHFIYDWWSYRTTIKCLFKRIVNALLKFTMLKIVSYSNFFLQLLFYILYFGFPPFLWKRVNRPNEYNTTIIQFTLSNLIAWFMLV